MAANFLCVKIRIGCGFVAKYLCVNVGIDLGFIVDSLLLILEMPMDLSIFVCVLVV